MDSKNIEFPLADIDGIDVNQDGNLFVASRFYSRIQVYNPKGDFVRGWFFYAPAGEIHIKINVENQIEVAALSFDKIDIFDEDGKLLKTNKYEDMYSWYTPGNKDKHLLNESTGLQYDIEGLVFPRIIQTGPDGEKKIGRNAFYLFPFQGPFQAIVTAFIGGFIIVRIEKKRKKKSHH